MTSINPQEVAKFNQHAPYWWDRDGPFKTLHDINPIRLAFVQDCLKENTLHCHADQAQRSSQLEIDGQEAPNLQNNKPELLDIGCGGGIFSEALAQAGFAVTGIDADLASIVTAQEHVKHTDVHINYIASTVEEHQGRYDIITCMELLEHVDDPFIILQHAARVLIDQGFLFVSTLNRTLTSYLQAVVGAEYILSLLPRQTHDYAKFIKPSELARMARSAGFELISLKGLHYNPFTRTAEYTSAVSVNYIAGFRKRITWL